MGAKADRAKGRIKEGLGGLTDNKRLKDKGRAADKVKKALD